MTGEPIGTVLERAKQHLGDYRAVLEELVDQDVEHTTNGWFVASSGRKISARLVLMLARRLLGGEVHVVLEVGDTTAQILGVYENQFMAEAVRDSHEGRTVQVVQASMNSDTGPPQPPADAPPAPPSWRCFHCDEVFTDATAAAEHFGASEARDTACRADASTLRQLEADNDELRRENERLDNDARLWHEAEADRVRRIGHCEWWQHLDSIAGEKLVLEQEIATLRARLPADAPPAPEPRPEPVMLPRWRCRQCGCLWRDNLDGTVSLFDGNQKSCKDCEGLPVAEACEVAWFKSHAEPVRADAPPAPEPDATPEALE